MHGVFYKQGVPTGLERGEVLVGGGVMLGKRFVKQG